MIPPKEYDSSQHRLLSSSGESRNEASSWEEILRVPWEKPQVATVDCVDWSNLSA
jgi:hypothetical protein